MAGLKVTEFDLAVAFDGSEIFGLVQAGGNVQTTLGDLTNYITTTITGGTATLELIRDTIGAALVAGAGIIITVDDPGDTITIASSITQYTDEMARDAIGAALVGGQGITSTVNDGADTITIDAVPDVQSVASAATVTPTFNDDAVKITAQAVGLTLANPTGTAVDMKGIVIRIKDNGTSRSITYDTQYRAVGVTLPTATVVNKTLYLGMIYNNNDTKWDVVVVKQEV